jgi:hypothetical protein
MDASGTTAPGRAVSVEREVSIARVFARAVEVVRAYPVPILGVTFGIGVLPALVFNLAGVSIATIATGQAATTGSEVIAGVGGFVSIVLWLVAMGALLTIVFAAADRRTPDIGAAVRTGLARCLPLLGVSILYWLGVSFASALLLIPGIMVAVMWSVSLCVIVAERPGVFGAFSRSRDMTRGVRWRVFGVMLVIFAAYVLLAAVGAAVGFATAGAATASGAAPVPVPFMAQVGVSVLNGLLTIGIIATLGSLYVELRDWTDGPASEDLADVFA